MSVDFLIFFISFLPSFLLGFIIWILLLGTTRFLDIVINLPQQGTQYWTYTCSCPYLKEQWFTHSVGSDSKSQSQSLINTPTFLQPLPDNRRRYSFWTTVFFSEKEMIDDVWYLFILRVIYYHHITLEIIWRLPRLVIEIQTLRLFWESILSLLQPEVLYILWWYLPLTSLLLHYLPVTSIVPVTLAADKLISQELSFNAAPSTAALYHWKLAFSRTPQDNCGAQHSNKRK